MIISEHSPELDLCNRELNLLAGLRHQLNLVAAQYRSSQITETERQQMKSELQAIFNSFKHNSHLSVSLESVDTEDYSMEGILETLKRFFKKIIELIKKGLTLLVKWFDDNFSKIAFLEKKHKQLTALAKRKNLTFNTPPSRVELEGVELSTGLLASHEGGFLNPNSYTELHEVVELILNQHTSIVLEETQNALNQTQYATESDSFEERLSSIVQTFGAGLNIANSIIQISELLPTENLAVLIKGVKTSSTPVYLGNLRFRTSYHTAIQAATQRNIELTPSSKEFTLFSQALGQTALTVSVDDVKPDLKVRMTAASPSAIELYLTQMESNIALLKHHNSEFRPQLKTLLKGINELSKLAFNLESRNDRFDADEVLKENILTLSHFTKWLNAPFKGLLHHTTQTNYALLNFIEASLDQY